MPELNNNRGLLAKNAEIREQMLKRQIVSTNTFFSIDGKKEYQDTFSKNNKLEDNASLMYANLVSLNAYINKDRFLDQKYITPSLTQFYGSNPQIDGNIGYYSIFNAHNGTYYKETGRIVDDYNEGVHFIRLDETSKSLEDLEKENGGIYYLQANVEKAKKYYSSEQHKSRKTSYSWNEPYTKDYVTHDDSEPFDKEEILTPKDIDEEQTIRVGDGIDSAKNVEDVIYNKTTSEGGLFKTTKSLFEENLLKNTSNTRSKNLKKKNSDSFVRNWRKYKQYNDSVMNLAGNYKSENGNSLLGINEIQQEYGVFRANGNSDYLSNNTVLEKTGFVNIVRRNDNVTSVEKNTIKRCMFSIENLAWKDVPLKAKYLSSEQLGPNGGRIMWFPPYDISFQENVNVDWNSNSFIGRGEKVYTYTNTERTGTLEFTLLIDHPNVLNYTKGTDATDEDILRFFEGEQLLQLNKAKEDATVKYKTSHYQEIDIEKELQQGSKEIKFTIYFPDNYSGMYLFNEYDIAGEREFVSNSEYFFDRDWWLYLLIGSDTFIQQWDEENDGWDGGAVPAEPIQTWRGYEISFAGLNINEDVQDTGEYPVFDEKLISKWHSVYNIENKGEILTDQWYGTRVDYDMIAPQASDDYYFETGSNLMLNGQVIPDGDVNEYDSNGRDYSFAETVAAISSFYNYDKYKVLTKYVDEVGGSEDRVNEIKNVINSFDIEYVSINTHASSSEGGNDKVNADAIAWRRGLLVENFLKKFLGKKGVQSDIITNNKEVIECVDKNPHSEEQKKARRVDVTISFKTNDITKLSQTATGRVPGQNEITEGYEILADDETKDITTEEIPPEENKSNLTENAQRYENEAQYFERIKETDRLTYEVITDKIKYFNPAFHSMSPEGFNARLTFLQQCTRQGHTVEVSDKNGFATTAGNLAFGRMPVCVLSLGDFICSRVIINSITINYSDNGMQWDLNKTGIGVQPMFAKVSLQLVLLGGQSLGGPVSRLQNAVSFNYYANTGVYDDRADITRTVKNENGKYETEFERGPWAPYPKNIEK